VTGAELAAPIEASPRSTAGPRSPRPIVPISYSTASMGGRLALHLAAGEGDVAARRAMELAAGRVQRWAARLTRHSETSELSALNADPAVEVTVGPTLAAALRAGQLAAEESEGLVDISLLDARLAAEGLAGAPLTAAFESTRRTTWPTAWSLAPGRRGSAVVERPAGLRFDLGGVGKGWIADRALGLLSRWPSVVVDADGDIAVRAAPGRVWEIGVDDPRAPGASLAVLRLAAPPAVPGRWGVATSGVSIHRWIVDGRPTHHLIDPRTGRPAATDVVQATVVAGTALRAEALAKAAVIAGSAAGFALLERARVLGAVLLTDRGETLALPQTLLLLES
jgi:thiamine biosynthesis lipoprotein